MSKVGTPPSKYTWREFFLYLFLSVILVSGSVTASYFLFHYIKKLQFDQSKRLIQAIVQTTEQTGRENPHFEASFFAEVLNLSMDQPISLNHLDLKEAKQRLLGTHVIKEVHLKKVKPNLLFIKYRARVPYLFLSDFSNTAMDTEGALFPFSPLYSPKKLPKLYLGRIVESPWGKQVDQEQLQLLHKLMQSLGSENVEQIDLSQVNAEEVGKREIVVKLKEGPFLRFSPKNYVQQLAHYSLLKTTLVTQGEVAVIDLRLLDLAYISPCP